MKHTQHNDPFDYDQYKDESFWDFSWENDWPEVVVVVVIVSFAVALLFVI